MPRPRLAAIAFAGLFAAALAASGAPGPRVAGQVATPGAATEVPPPPGLFPVYADAPGAAVYIMAFDGESMAPAIRSGDDLLVDAAAFGASAPDRGDVVVFYPPDFGDRPFARRVVGLPGERVTIRRGAVLVDGEELDDPYAVGRTECRRRGEYCDVAVPENAVFVLGDNRGNAADSRIFGPVPMDSVAGRAWFALPGGAGRLVGPAAAAEAVSPDP